MKIAKIYMNTDSNEVSFKKGYYCFAEILKIGGIGKGLFTVKLIDKSYDGKIDYYLEESKVKFTRGKPLRREMNVRLLDKHRVGDAFINKSEIKRFVKENTKGKKGKKHDKV